MQPVMTRLYVAQLIERFEKENRSFKIYTDFRPNPAVQPVTGKFYSRYDSMTTEPNPHFVDVIARYEQKTPKDKVSYPETVNQEYGWYKDPLVPRDVNDRKYKLQHGRKMDPLIELESTIRLANVGSKK